MRSFDYEAVPLKQLTPEVVQMLCRIHEYKGRQKLMHKSAAQKLHFFPKSAAIKSAEAYSRIDGANISGKNLEKLIRNQIQPSNRTEDEIIGYLAALAYVGKNYHFTKLDTSVIINIFRRLDPDSRGAMEAGPWNRPELLFISDLNSLRQLEILCDSFNQAWDQDHVDKLILIAMFVLDFYNINPFAYGSEKMSRLLLQLLLLRAGYIAVKYVSMDTLIEESRRTYYNVLSISSDSWTEENNDYMQYIVCILGLVIRAYKEFEQLIEQLSSKKVSKPDRVRALFEDQEEPLSKREILAVCPDISKITVERSLNEMLKEGYLQKIGAGPSTAYIRK